MKVRVFCSSTQTQTRRLRPRSLSVSLAALLTGLIGVAGCSADAAGASSVTARTTSPPATGTTSPAATSSVGSTASPLPLGSATIDGDEYKFQLYSLPKKVDAAAWADIGSILKRDDDKSLITVVDIEQKTAGDSFKPDESTVSDIVAHREQLAVLTQPTQTKDPEDNPLGDAGSLIFALAKYRFSDYLTSSSTLRALDKLKPPCGDKCTAVIKGPGEVKDDAYRLAGQPVTAALLKKISELGSGASTGSTTSSSNTSGSGQQAVGGGKGDDKNSGGSGGENDLLPWILVGVLTAALVAGVAFVLRRERPTGRDARVTPNGGGAPGRQLANASPAPARNRTDDESHWADPGRRRGGSQAREVPQPSTSSPAATEVARVHSPDVEIGQSGLVHSEFRETGYVSVDGALYRAVWKGEEHSRPRIGESVVLYTDVSDGLQAWPAASADGRRRRGPGQ